MRLFTVANNKAVPSPDVLLIKPFSDIWKRDKDPEKNRAISELTYVEFMCSPRQSNPFNGYDIGVREEKIIDKIFDGEYEPDVLVTLAIDQYNEWLREASPSMSYCLAAKGAARKIEKYFDSVDLTKTDSRGNLVYKITDISRVIKESADVLKSVNDLINNVEKELYESVRTKGGKTIGHYED